MNHILTNKQGIKIGAAVNDFASLNIDAALVRKTLKSKVLTPGGVTEVVELNNGCICCSLATDVKDVVWDFLNMEDDDR